MKQVNLARMLAASCVFAAACSGDSTPTQTPIPTAATPTPSASSGTPAATQTPAASNARPVALLGEIEVDGQRVFVPVTVQDDDGDLVDLSIVFSEGGDLFQTCTRANGSDNTLQVPSGQTVTFVWNTTDDVAGETDVTLRVLPFDGKQAGDPAISGTFTATGEGGGSGGTSGSADDLESEGGFVDPSFNGSASVTVDLNESEERDNQEEEFLVIVVNVSNKAAAFVVGEEGAVPEDTPTPVPTPDEGALRVGVPAEVEPLDEVAVYGGEPAWEPVLRQGPLEVGVTQEEFRVLNSFSKSTYKTVLAILAATNQGVNIYVDQDIPIDWDYNCDGVINPSDGDEYDRFGRNAYGFDTCDLDQVSSIFSENILTNLHTYFGEESDVDNNGAVTVLLTPVLNTINQTNSDSSDDDQVREVLAYPQVDLIEYDSDDNPGSNYQEIFYLPAPDPAGFFNPQAGGGGEQAIETYVTLTMAANLAQATQSLISFNQHVLEADGEKEENWLDAGLGLLAADLTGFGGRIYDDLFDYLATPNLSAIALSETGVGTTASAYLFCRYLVDRFGTEILQELMTSGLTGSENIEAAIQSFGGPSSIDELMLDYATTLFLGGYEGSDGESLVDPTYVPAFLSATTIPATGSTDYPGAEGYQQGVNVRGDNYQRSRRGDQLLLEAIYRLNGADWGHYAPGTPYSGYVVGGYAFTAVRVGGLIDETSKLGIATNGDLAVRVVRLPDLQSGGRTFITEQIYGARTTTPMRLDLRTDGWASVALGEIDPSESLSLLDTGDRVPVVDTDLYSLDLTSWPEAEVTLDLYATRKTGATGSPSLESIVVALAPAGDVPDAESIQGTWICGGVTDYVDYPNDYLQYLYYQTVLNAKTSPAAYESDSLQGLTCDFDGDSVPDALEPRPTTLVDQISTWQKQTLGGASSVADGDFYPFDEVYQDYVGIDGIDDDAIPYANPVLGINTRNTDEGEEAFVRVTVPAGGAAHKYIVVVGGPGSTGPYELTVTPVSEP